MGQVRHARCPGCGNDMVRWVADWDVLLLRGSAGGAAAGTASAAYGTVFDCMPCHTMLIVTPAPLGDATVTVQADAQVAKEGE